jgi:hypothetical protein
MENEQDGFLCKRAIENKTCGGYQPMADGKKWCKPPKSRNGLHKAFEGNKARGTPFTLPETLNKREMIAAMAMQGLLASEDSLSGNVVRWAVEYADDLLKELEKTK